MKIALAVVLSLLASVLAAQEAPAAFQDYAKRGGEQVASRRDVAEILVWVADARENVFDFLDEAGSYLKRNNTRLTIRGDDLRAVTAGRFRLGDSRVDALFPLSTLVSLSFGARLDHEGEVDIFLSEPHSGFLELGDFFLSKHYGFRRLEDKSLEEAFGVTVKRGWLTFDLEKVVRVPDPTGLGRANFIAIYLHFFPRPKQWLIDPIKVLR